MVITFKELNNFDTAKKQTVMLYFKPALPDNVSADVLNQVNSVYEKTLDFRIKQNLINELNTEKLSFDNLSDQMFADIEVAYGSDIAKEAIAAVKCVLEGALTVDRTRFVSNVINGVKPLITNDKGE